MSFEVNTVRISEKWSSPDLPFKNPLKEFYASLESAGEVNQIDDYSVIVGTVTHMILESIADHGIELWEGQSELLHMIVGLSGMAYAGAIKSDSIRRWRNPLTYPIEAVMKRYKFANDLKNVGGPYTLKLSNHVHPTLDTPAKLLENGIRSLENAVERSFVNHGIDVGMKEARKISYVFDRTIFKCSILG